jgi:NADH oxidase (H2O-forming)
MNDANVLRVSERVHWIGVQDPDLLTFDVVMETRFGTTYNSYFIDAPAKTIVDATKEKFWDEYLAKISKLTRPEEIKYIIVNHTEPDHSGNIRNLLRLAKDATVVGSGTAMRYLRDLIGEDFRHMVVRNDEELDLGDGMKLRFLSAPNLHWPDTMYTWFEADQILFTCDSFGAHFAHEAMFDDQVGDYSESLKYYFDVILKPYSSSYLKAIDKVRALDVHMICPGHGPILRSNWMQVVDTTEQWCKQYLSMPDKKHVFIPYVSAYDKTGTIARFIAQGIRECGDFEVELVDIEHSSLGSLEEKVSLASAIIVGSPTINQNILLPIYKLFAVINPVRDRYKLAGGFGSYGWSGEGAKLIKDALTNLKLDYLGEGVFLKFSLDADKEQECLEYGRSLGRRLTEISAKQT